MPTSIFVGRIRSVVTHVLLTFLTLGIWAFVWLALVSNDLRKHRQAQGAHPVAMVLVFLLVPVIGWLVVGFLLGGSVRKIQREADADKRTSPWYPALWSLVPVVGWAIMLGTLQSGANWAWLRIHRDLEHADEPRVLECPDCTNRFDVYRNPVGSQTVRCDHCGKTGTI